MPLRALKVVGLLLISGSTSGPRIRPFASPIVQRQQPISQAYIQYRIIKLIIYNEHNFMLLRFSYPPYFDDDPFKIYDRILDGKITWPKYTDPVAKQAICFCLIQSWIFMQTAQSLFNIYTNGSTVFGISLAAGIMNLIKSLSIIVMRCLNSISLHL